MSEEQPEADADAPAFSLLTTPSPWITARRDYRRAIIRLVFVLGLLVLVASVGGGVAALVDRKARAINAAGT
jgi:hypothetical protein